MAIWYHMVHIWYHIVWYIWYHIYGTICMVPYMPGLANTSQAWPSWAKPGPAKPGLTWPGQTRQPQRKTIGKLKHIWYHTYIWYHHVLISKLLLNLYAQLVIKTIFIHRQLNSYCLLSCSSHYSHVRAVLNYVVNRSKNDYSSDWEESMQLCWVG